MQNSNHIATNVILALVEFAGRRSMIYTVLKIALVIFLFAICSPTVFAQRSDLIVVVTDATGRTIDIQKIEIAPANSSIKKCELAEGEFRCPNSTVGDVIRIKAAGFETVERIIVEAEVFSGRATITMTPTKIREEVIVGIGRVDVPIGETPESISVLARRDLAATAAPTLDDALRQVPGFSIFRRSSSRNANPTTQGVSLRGVGTSGASRSIVMFDGVPLNDPFGGWVQWNRISPVAVESIEVLRGGASSLYGNSSLSGAIALEPRTVTDAFAFSGEFFCGTERTLSGSAFTVGKYKNWFGDVAGGHFQTRGIIPVEEASRGPVDSFAGARSSNVSARAGRDLGAVGSIFFRTMYFGESRTNGTPAQVNRTHSRQFVAGGKITPTRSALRFDWRAYGGTQVYDQTFSAVSADRSTENLTRIQRSPSQNFGVSVQASTVVGRHTFVGGFEGREVRGASNETGIANGIRMSRLGAGGRERSIGVFFKDVINVGDRLTLSGSIRYDRWRNFRALSTTQILSTGAATATSFPDRDEGAFSPQASIQFRLNENVAFNASASKSFRVPTLNELYRGFRVGNVVTNANADLRAERATNFEAGSAVKFKLISVRATAFLTKIDGAVSNVTISETPNLITRQRQNAGRTRTAGFEFDAETEIEQVDLRFGYLFAHSVVEEFLSSPALIDKQIPQVPRHQATFQARYVFRDWVFSAQARASGEQFDDDLNQFRLEPYFQLDLFVSRRLGEKLTAFGAVENLFNSRYSVGRTPIRTVSSGLSARVGIRWN